MIQNKSSKRLVIARDQIKPFGSALKIIDKD